MGDGSESGKQGSTARNRMGTRGRRGGNGGGSAGAKLKIIVHTVDLAQIGDPR